MFIFLKFIIIILLEQSVAGLHVENESLITKW